VASRTAQHNAAETNDLFKYSIPNFYSYNAATAKQIMTDLLAVDAKMSDYNVLILVVDNDLILVKSESVCG
jgi:hypothetical protein